MPSHRSGSLQLRHAEPRVCSTGSGRRNTRLAAVRPGDRLDNCEAEPAATPSAGRVGTGEALEGARQELGGNAFAVVGDVKFDVSLAALGVQGDLVAAVA